MASSKKYKFITIEQIGGETFERKPVYRIFNNKALVQTQELL